MEFATKQLRQRFDRQEKVVAGFAPLPIGGQPACRNQIMDMGMLGHIPRPGLQDADRPHLSADETWIEPQLLRSFGGEAKEQIIEQLLMAAGGLAQFFWESKGQHDIRDWQQQSLLLLKPFLPPLVLALRAMTVAVGVIAVTHLLALRAIVHLPTDWWIAQIGEPCPSSRSAYAS